MQNLSHQGQEKKPRTCLHNVRTMPHKDPKVGESGHTGPFQNSQGEPQILLVNPGASMEIQSMPQGHLSRIQRQRRVISKRPVGEVFVS